MYFILIPYNTILQYILNGLIKHTRQFCKCRPLFTVIVKKSSDTLPTGCQQVTDCRPTVGRQSANTLASNITQTVGRQLGNCRPTVGQQSADCWPTVGRLLSNCRPTVGQQLANSRPTVGRQLTDSRPPGFLGSSSSQLPFSQV